MYLECHIVVSKPSDARKVFAIGRKDGFWGSQLTRDEGVEERAGDVILTTRDRAYFGLCERIKTLVYNLRTSRETVSRYKIEEIRLDSNTSDALGLGVGTRTHPTERPPGVPALD